MQRQLGPVHRVPAPGLQQLVAAGEVAASEEALVGRQGAEIIPNKIPTTEQIINDVPDKIKVA